MGWSIVDVFLKLCYLIIFAVGIVAVVTFIFPYSKCIASSVGLIAIVIFSGYILDEF